MSRPCRNVEDIVSEVRRIIEEEKAANPQREANSGFSVRGDSMESRRKRILLVSVLSPMAGFLLASVHLEWTIRRAILSLGRKSTKEMKEEMKKKHGLDAYKDLWNDEVVKASNPRRPRLPELVERARDNSSVGSSVRWTDLIRAMKVRHTIVHGRECTAGVSFLENNIETLLGASETITSFVKASGGDIYATIRRGKPKKIKERSPRPRNTKQSSEHSHQDN